MLLTQPPQPGRFHAQSRRNGFTLIEVIVVLILLGILAAVAVNRYIDLQDSARARVLDGAIAELNGRERLVWSRLMIQFMGEVDDDMVWAEMDFDLGPDFDWTGQGAVIFPVGGPDDIMQLSSLQNPTQAGGALFYQGQAVDMTRDPATEERPARWSRIPFP